MLKVHKKYSRKFFQNLLLNVFVLYGSGYLKSLKEKSDAVVVVSNLHRIIILLNKIYEANPLKFLLKKESKELLKPFIDVICQLITPFEFMYSEKIEKVEDIIFSFIKFLELSGKDKIHTLYESDYSELLHSIFNELNLISDIQKCGKSLPLLLCQILNVKYQNDDPKTQTIFYTKKRKNIDFYNGVILRFFDIFSTTQKNSPKQCDVILIPIFYLCVSFGFINKTLTIDSKYNDIVRFLDECQKGMYGLDEEKKELAKSSYGCLNCLNKVVGKK
jgi:hypothetical protein